MTRQTARINTSSPADQSPFWTPSGIARAAGGQWLRQPDNLHQPLVGVSIDTRTLKRGQVFIAITGPTFDGCDFLRTAFQKHAALAIVAKPIDHPPGPTLLVADTIAALQALARSYRAHLAAAGVTVIAVAGSNGKTTTRHLIHTALQKAIPTERARPLRGTQSPASFNNHLGVPLTLLAAELDHDFVVVEIGTNHPGEIAPLAKIASPDIAVITSLGREHLEHFTTLQAVITEEASLLHHLAPGAIALIETNAWQQITALAPPPADLRIQTFGLTDADLIPARDPQPTPAGQHIFLAGNPAFDLPLPGGHNASNALAAVAVARYLGIDDPTIARQLAATTPMPGRFQVQTLGSITLIHDAYNANPDSVIQSLTTFAPHPPPTPPPTPPSTPPSTSPISRRIAILGDMLELGEHAPDLHRAVGQHILSLIDPATDAPLIAPVILIGPLALFIGETLLRHWPAERIHTFPAWSDDLPEKIAALLAPGDTVLLKASRGMKLERLIPAIQKRFAS